MFIISHELRYLIEIMGKRRTLYLFFTIILLSLADLAGIAIVLPYLQVVMHPEKLQSIGIISNWHSTNPDLSNSFLLMIVSIALSLLFLFKTLFVIGLTRYQFRQLAWLTNYLTSKVMNLALNARYSIFHDIPVSQVAGKAYSNTVHASLFFQTAINFFNDLLFLLLFLLGFSIFYPWFALSFIIAMLLIGGGIYIGIVQKVAKLGTQQTTIENEKHQLLHFIAAGMRDINVMGLGSFFSKRNSIVADKCAEVNWRYNFQNSLPRALIELLMLLAFIGTVMMFLNMDRNQLDSLAPVLGVLAVASLRLIPAFSKLIASVNGYRFSRSFVTHLKELITTLDKVQIHREEDNLIFSNAIKLHNVSFSYGEKIILRNINIIIRKKKSIGIVGPSGAGKSTLLDIITGLQPSATGTFFCDRRRFNPFKSLSIQRITGYVPQKITLLNASVVFNITFEDNYDIDRLEKAIKSANLKPVLDSLTHGIDTLVGENGVRLSGGQAQRIGIARAIYRQPGLLIFDEATSALDNITEKQLTNEIRALSKDMAVIIVAHRLTTVIHCDYIYVMEHGQIIDVGSHDELMQRCLLYKNMHQTSQHYDTSVVDDNYA